MGKSTTIDRRPEAEAPPDRGCWVAPKCETCWLCECVLILPPAERRKIKDALTVLQVFARPELTARKPKSPPPGPARPCAECGR